MATAYLRVSTWWGTVEAYKTDEQVYSAAQRKPMGENANAPNTAARRAMLTWTRTPTPGPEEDVAVTHFDFLNMTNGNPDDTWTAADFDNVTASLVAYLTPIASFWHTSTVLDKIRYYRIGPGIPKPNPPVHISDVNIAGTASGSRLPPQCAITVTDRTGVRLEWGRKYLPLDTHNVLNAANGRLSTASVDALATQMDGLYSNLAGQDFVPIVYGPTRQKTYSIESVQVDDVVDIVRRRRWDSPFYKRRIPAGG